MEPESPFSTWLEQKYFERLQSEGLRVRELRHFCQGSFRGLVEECYRQWRNGHLIVSRKWGNWQSEEKTVIYLNSACLLPDDLLRWQKSSSEVKVYRVATWNVNSIRSRMEVLINWLESWKPDVLCIQETKVEDANFPVWEIEQAGYQSVFVGQKTYNGVAILSRQPLKEVCRGFENGYDSENARIISAIWQGIRLVNVYVPQGQDTGTDKFRYKLEFLEQLLNQIQADRASDSDMLILGDFNVALEPGDVIVFHMLALHGAGGNTSLSTSRRVLATRWCGDDARFTMRDWEISPTVTGGLSPGDAIGCDLFPVVWPRR